MANFLLNTMTKKIGFLNFRTKPHAKRFNKVEIIEINPTAKDVKKVKFVDRNQVVDSNVQVSFNYRISRENDS